MNLTSGQVLKRYGPILALGTTVGLLVVLLPSNDDGRRRDAPAPAGLPAVPNGNESGPAATVAGAPAEPVPGDSSAPPGTAARSPAGKPRGAAASQSGVAARGGAGPSAQAAAPGAEMPRTAVSTGPVGAARCRPDGRMDGFSIYMPPCVPVFRGDNGGATARGVSRDKIVVVRFMSRANPAFAAFLQSIGADDGRAKNDDMDATLVDYLNSHIETYGREVVVRTYEATGEDDDETALRRDATVIAEQIKPFAVFYTLPQSAPVDAFAEELAARGVVCICTFSASRSFYARTAPYVWAWQPALEDYYQAMAEYIGKRLARKNATWAGDELNPTQGYRTRPRKFGLIYVNGRGQSTDPGADEGRRFYEQELSRYGVNLSQAVSYLFDVSRQQEQATNMIAKMKTAGVSTLLCMCDPLYPIFLTNEATRQSYFPEWLFTEARGPLDTTFFGRNYNQAQWRHAFGLSTQPLPSARFATTPGYKAYHHMRPQARDGDEGKAINHRMTTVQLLFLGIQMAGPYLTPQTFARGLYAFPPTGGQPKFPLIDFAPSSPVAISDFSEVFWNPNARGPDEVGHDGLGVLMKAEGGRRYRPGQWEAKDPKIFTSDGAVVTSDTPPESSPHDADGHRHSPQERCRSCV